MAADIKQNGAHLGNSESRVHTQLKSGGNSETLPVGANGSFWFLPLCGPLFCTNTLLPPQDHDDGWRPGKAWS